MKNLRKILLAQLPSERPHPLGLGITVGLALLTCYFQHVGNKELAATTLAALIGALLPAPVHSRQVDDLEAGDDETGAP